MSIKEELMESLEKMFEELMMRDDIDFDRIKWEFDYIIYPGIGSYIADGSLTKEEGKEVFVFCELKLRELKIAFETR